MITLPPTPVDPSKELPASIETVPPPRLEEEAPPRILTSPPAPFMDSPDSITKRPLEPLAACPVRNSMFPLWPCSVAPV